jgi:hypothetical protein
MANQLARSLAASSIADSSSILGFYVSSSASPLPPPWASRSGPSPGMVGINHRVAIDGGTTNVPMGLPRPKPARGGCSPIFLSSNDSNERKRKQFFVRNRSSPKRFPKDISSWPTYFGQHVFIPGQFGSGDEPSCVIYFSTSILMHKAYIEKSNHVKFDQVLSKIINMQNTNQ